MPGCVLCKPLGCVKAEIEFVRHLNRTRFRAGITSYAFIINKARIHLYRDIIIAFLAGDLLDLCKRIEGNIPAVLDPLIVHFESAVRGAELGEILVELCHPSAEKWSLLYNDNLETGFCSLDCRSQAAETSADYQTFLFSAISILLKGSNSFCDYANCRLQNTTLFLLHPAIYLLTGKNRGGQRPPRLSS